MRTQGRTCRRIAFLDMREPPLTPAEFYDFFIYWHAVFLTLCVDDRRIRDEQSRLQCPVIYSQKHYSAFNGGAQFPRVEYSFRDPATQIYVYLWTALFLANTLITSPYAMTTITKRTSRMEVGFNVPKLCTAISLRQ